MPSTPQAASTSADVPFHGLVETTGDALRLIQAARQGVIPRITRRLNEDERGRVVCSGAVFIFSVEESGIRRWTEGLSWSASRIAGNFLLYRELTSRNSGRTSYTGKALSAESAFSRRKLVTPRDQDHQPTFKPGGLIKKTITVAADGTHYHLISYYNDEDVRARRLHRPSNRSDIMALVMPSDLLEASNFRYPPRVDVSSNGSVMNIRDADEVEVFPTANRPPSSSQPGSTVSFSQDEESSRFLLRSSRRPRAIRPARPPSPERPTTSHCSTTHDHSEAYVSSNRTEDFWVALPSSSSLYAMTSSPASTFSAPGSPTATSWHENQSNFGADSSSMVESYGHNNMMTTTEHFDSFIPSSAPLPSTLGEDLPSRRDDTRSLSYSSGTSSFIDDSSQSAYYNHQHMAYQQDSIFYPPNYDTSIPYSSPGYYGPFIHEDEW